MREKMNERLRKIKKTKTDRERKSEVTFIHFVYCSYFIISKLFLITTGCNIIK